MRDRLAKSCFVFAGALAECARIIREHLPPFVSAFGLFLVDKLLFFCEFAFRAIGFCFFLSSSNCSTGREYGTTPNVYKSGSSNHYRVAKNACARTCAVLDAQFFELVC